MSLKVAFLVNAYPVLSEAFIMNAAAGLVRSGCTVDILSLYGSPQSAVKRHFVQDELDRSVRVLRPRASGGERLQMKDAVAAWRRSQAAFGWRSLRSLDPFVFGRDALAMRPLFAAEMLADSPAYDIVHCQFATLAPFALRLRRASLLRGRILVHFRGYDISRHVKENGNGVYRGVFRDADWFVANCRFFRDRAISLGCDPALIDVVPSGNDLGTFPYQPRMLLDNHTVKLVAVGRLVDKKGFGIAVEAVSVLRKRGRAVTLRIIGEGPLRTQLEAAIKEAQLERIVELVGQKPHEEIASELAAAHIFIAPCVTAADGDQDAPVNTLKEAMASGAPVVASRHGGIPELVENNVSGLLVQEGDANLLADGIDRLIANAARWPEMGRAGREKVEREYSLAASNAKLLAVYEQALSRNA